MVDRYGLRPIASTLRIDPANGRFFVDAAGKAVVLAGMHTWTNLQDADNASRQDPPDPFDWDCYLDTIVGYGQNFIRLWMMEYVDIEYDDNKPHFTPAVHERTGPGLDLAGKPRFDLTRLNQAYFDRLGERVAEAGARGVYVSIMLFEGVWSSGQVHWDGHPFNGANNVNGVDVEPLDSTESGWGYGSNYHSLADPRVLELQRAYVRKVIDTVGDLDNVLYEISNEDWGSPANIDWQYAMIEFIHEYESGRAKQHPVGMTPTWNQNNDVVFNSPADWISPCDCMHRPVDENGGRSYTSDPPAAGGQKVVLVDTDHIFGIGGDATWVWKTFSRGYSPIYMYQPESVGPGRSVVRDAATGGALRAMGDVVSYGTRMDLGRHRPSGELSSTGYALADPGREYLVYQPLSGELRLDIAEGEYTVEWFRPGADDPESAGTVRGGGRQAFAPPFDGPGVLFLQRT